jgi:AraC-like DNA-binding protein
MDQHSALFDNGAGTMRVRLKAQRTHVHANLVPCIIFGRDGPISIETTGGFVSGEALMVNANWDHIVNFHGNAADVIYLEASAGVVQGSWQAKPVSDATLHVLEQYADDLSHDVSHALADTIGGARPRLDDAIVAIQHEIVADPMARFGELEASRLVGLERTTMLRRFKQQTEMTFRAYKSWVALKYATRLVMTGEQIGNAGLDAGFADAAHFSRQFRATFGLTPTQARECII